MDQKMSSNDRNPRKLLKSKWILFRISALILGLVFAFVCAEVLARLVFPDYLIRAGTERNFFCDFDPLLGWRHKSNFSAQHERYGFSVYVHHNQYGIRGPDTITTDKPPKKKRCLVLGDSSAWGFGANQDEVFTDPKCHKSEDVELINFSVSGYGTDQELLHYERLGESFQADSVALVVTLDNDFGNNLSAREYGYSKPYFTLDGDSLVLHTEQIRPPYAKRFRDFWRTRLVIVNYLDAVFRSAKTRRKIKTKSTAKTNADALLTYDDLPEEYLESVKLTARIIKRLQEKTKAQGREFFVVFVPSKNHIENLAERNHPLAAPLAAELQALGIEYREPYFIFLEKRKKGHDLFNPWEDHLNASGHLLFAKVFVEDSTINAVKNLYSK